MNALDVALTLLNFTAAEFAQAPALDVSGRIAALLSSDFQGVAISAPATAKAGDALPIAVAVRFSAARAWDYPLARNATLVATNLDTGAVVVSDPFRPMGGHKRNQQRDALDRGTRPPEDQLQGISADIAWTDAERAELPVEPGRWRIELIYHDWVSNSIDLAVAGTPVLPGPQAPWPLPREGAPLPSYIPAAGALADPGVGFDLKAAEVDGRQSLLLSGHVRVPLRPWMAFEGALTEGGTARPVTATVPVTTIWTAQNASPAVALNFLMPVYDQAEGMVSGAFRLDLLDGAEDYRLPAGLYTVWLLVDGALHGPQRVEVAPPR